MDVVILLVFISLGLVAASLLFFVHRLREGDFDHADRLALAPLDDEPPMTADGGTAAPAGEESPNQHFARPPAGGLITSPPGEQLPVEPQGGSPHARS